MMPDGASRDRADQLATLGVIWARDHLGARMPDLLARAGRRGLLDPWRDANLREMRRSWVHERAASDLVEDPHARLLDLRACLAFGPQECRLLVARCRRSEVLTIMRRVGE